MTPLGNLQALIEFTIILKQSIPMMCENLTYNSITIPLGPGALPWAIAFVTLCEILPW